MVRSIQKPISLLLIGKPSIGKSRLLSPLRNGKEVSYVNDITPKYLEFLGKVKNKEKKFLVVPDFTKLNSLKKKGERSCGRNVHPTTI